MSEYQRQAVDFLRKAGATITFERDSVVYGFPFDDHDRLPHWKWIVTLRRGNKKYVFPFFDSYQSYKDKKQPTRYDILACLQKDDVGEMADFVEEYGYVIKDRKSFLRVENIWRECKDQYQKLLDLFGEELLDELRKIS